MDLFSVSPNLGTSQPEQGPQSLSETCKVTANYDAQNRTIVGSGKVVTVPQTYQLTQGRRGDMFVLSTGKESIFFEYGNASGFGEEACRLIQPIREQEQAEKAHKRK